MLKKRNRIGFTLCLVLIIGIISSLLTCTAVGAVDEPTVAPYTSHITSYVGADIDVKFRLYHAYNDERLFVNVYNSKGKIVASTDDYFGEDDDVEQIFTFTWFAKKAKAKAGEYTLVATMAYYTYGEWQLCSEDTVVAITLKNIPAPKLKSAKNVKGKKITAKWSAVSKAAKYQVKIGSKTYTAKKTSYTAKKLKKGKTYKVAVRAYRNKRWSKWSNSKKVKVNK